MTPQDLENKILSKNPVAPRVSLEDLNANIKDVEYLCHTTKTGTVLRWAILTTVNGSTVVGNPSMSVSPENDNEEIGKTIAKDSAIKSLWSLMGYALKESLAQSKKEIQ